MSTYKAKLDLRDDDGKKLIAMDNGGYVRIFVEDSDNETEILLSYKQWDKLSNDLKNEWED